MRRIRYQVATSLDGYIADRDGGTKWIVDEPTIDFDELFDQFDTLLMGRLTYEGFGEGPKDFWGKKVYVFSRTLRQEEHPQVTIVSENIEDLVKGLRAAPGKDIWLFGGGSLLETFLDLKLVDTIEPAIIPSLVGGGHPFLASATSAVKLSLVKHRVFPSGIVWLDYEVQYE